MSARVEWNKLPYYAQVRAKHYGDLESLFDRHNVDDRIYRQEETWNDAWDALLPARQLEILSDIREELVGQTLAIGNVIEELEDQIYGINNKAHARGQMRRKANTSVIVPRPSDAEVGRDSVSDDRREGTQPIIQSHP